MENSRKSNRDSIWTKKFVTMFIINILVNSSLYMVNTLVPKATASLNATITIVGIVSSTFAVTSLLSRPFVGASGNFLCSRTILRISVSILIMAYFLFGLAKSVPMMIAGRLMQGIGMAFVGPICLTIASNSIPQDKMASGIAIFSIGQASANAFGPAIGLWLASHFGYGPAFFIGSALMLVSLFLSEFVPKEKVHVRDRFRFSLNTIIAKEALAPGIIFFFLGGVYSCVVSYIVLYGESCGVENSGVFFTAYAVFVMISRFFSGRIGEKYGMSSVIIPGMLCYAISFYIISISHSTFMFIFAGAFSALGYGICQPSIQALCLVKVPDERRNVAGNTCYFGVDMGYMVMPTVAGTIITTVQNNGGTVTQGYIAMYRIMPVFILCALIIYIISEKPRMPKRNKIISRES